MIRSTIIIAIALALPGCDRTPEPKTTPSTRLTQAEQRWIRSCVQNLGPGVSAKNQMRRCLESAQQLRDHGYEPTNPILPKTNTP